MTAAAGAGVMSPVKQALYEIRRLRRDLESERARNTAPVAVIGAGVRLPGGIDSLEALWTALRAGVDAVGPEPRDRWDRVACNSPVDSPGRYYVDRGAYLDGVADFDPEFFGIAPAEAITMDPQQRLLLEVVWEALEHAGIAPTSLRGSRTGVFAGVGNNDYARLVLSRRDLIDAYATSGTSYSVVSGRVAYVLGLEGPALSVDTACSASLVATHLACQSLRAGECDLALAGGVNLILAPEVTMDFCRAGMLSREGRCKTFDAAADGYVRGEGCGVVVLKRMSDAERDGDRILAVIRGTAINQDGRSSGLTAPSGPAQAAVIRAALAQAGLAPEDIDYVETHGTGTSLGDPIEVGALAAVFGATRSAEWPLLIGSVKTNFGHLEAAAGVTGLLKAVLAVQHGEVPPHLHLTTPNPHIPWSELPIRVATRLTPWPGEERASGDDAASPPRRAGVSSFGFSGTNAHVILESAPPRTEAAPRGPVRPLELLTLSAPSSDSLRASVARWTRYLRQTSYSFGDVCHTAGAGRAHFAHRLAVVATNGQEAALALERWLEGDTAPGLVAGEIDATRRRPATAFVVAVGAEDASLIEAVTSLRTTEPVVQGAYDVLFRALGAGPDSAAPAVSAVTAGLALTRLWRSWGIEPDLVLGQGPGALVAAAVAGVFSPVDALRLAATQQGRLQMPTGSAGDSSAPGPGFETGAPAGLAIDAVAEVLRAVQPQVPERVRLLSTVTGGAPPPERLADPEHWVRELAGGPRLADALDIALAEEAGWLVEIGTISLADRLPAALRRTHRVDHDTEAGHERDPGLELARDPASNRESSSAAHVVVPGGLALAERATANTGAAGPGVRLWRALLDGLARLYVAGADLDWKGLAGGRRRTPVPVPTQVFQRRRFWIGDSAPPADDQRAAAWRSSVRAATRQAAHVPIDMHLGAYRRAWRTLEELTVVLGRNALISLGAFPPPGNVITLESVLERAGIRPIYAHIVGRCLEALAGRGDLERTGAGFLVIQPLAPVNAEPIWAEVEALLAADGPLLDYLRHSGRRFPEVLTGHTNPLETLFPGGSFHLAEALYERSAILRYANAVAAAALDAYVSSIPGGVPIRVLEVGAGTGSTTAALLPVLPADRVTYDYTDVSNLFLEHGAAKFVDYARLHTRFFDLERDPVEQGLMPGSYDVVVASNAVHAVARIEPALRNLRSLLAPGGLLLLVESTGHHAWHDFTTALIEGWQRHDDELRSGTPLLDVDTWRTVLVRAGFAGVAVAPESGSPAEVLKQHVILAVAPASREQVSVSPADGTRRAAGRANPTATRTPNRVGEIPTVRAGAETAGDVRASNAIYEPTHVQPAVIESAIASADQDSSFLLELRSAPPSEREDIAVRVVREAVMGVLKSDPSRPPGRDARLMDLGFDSLMAVRLHNVLQPLVPEPLPPTLVFDYPTIRRIAGLLCSIAESVPTSIVTADGGDRFAAGSRLANAGDPESPSSPEDFPGAGAAGTAGHPGPGAMEP